MHQRWFPCVLFLIGAVSTCPGCAPRGPRATIIVTEAGTERVIFRSHFGTSGATFPKQPAEQTSAKAVEALKALLKKVEKDGTKERVTSEAPGRWHRERHQATNLHFDVRRTGSLVSPYAADVTWADNAYISAECTTHEEAEKAALPTQVTVADLPSWARLAFLEQEGVWAIQEIGWIRGGLESKQSAPLRGDTDVTNDWWKAFGGI